MRRLTKRLYRERRRLALVAILTFLGGYIAFFHRTTALFGIPFSVVAGLAFMVGLTAGLMFVVVFFPKLRHSAESVALSIPVLSLMGVFGDTTDGGLSTNAGIYGFLLVYLTFTVYAGNWMDRYLPRRPKCMHSFASSKLRPEELWPYLTASPDTFPKHAPEGVLSMDWIERGVKFRQICREGELAKIEEIHTIEVNEPFQRYRFSFVVPDATETASVSRGHKEMKLNTDGNGTRLETIREFDRVTIRAQILIWIDDGMGRLDDEEIYNAEIAERS